MQECIFCGIVGGSVPSKKVYEDDRALIVLDIYPANPGHLLLLPKEHFAVLNQLPEEIVEHLGLISKRATELLFKLLKAEGVTIFVANGAAAGQRAPHLIIHIIPRFGGDGLNFGIAEKEFAEEEMAALYERMQPALKNWFAEHAQPKEPVDLDKLAELLLK